jgi:hypothetical protein
MAPADDTQDDDTRADDTRADSTRADDTRADDTRADDSQAREPSAHTREGGGGEPVPADDPRDESVVGEDAGTAAEKSTPPTEGPAAAGALPG